MQHIPNLIPDLTIVSLIKENNLKGWELLYDKYAPVIYGAICTHTADKHLSDEILKIIFIRLKSEEMLQKTDFALCIYILRYTYTSTRAELKRRGINYTENPILGNSILHIFCSQQTTVKQVSEKLQLSKTEVKEILHKEFLSFRAKNQHTIAGV